MKPKVLVLSNNCFSQSSSNGRTLGNLFVGWPKECLAQFFLTGIPDEYYCNNYFQISDSHMLSMLKGKQCSAGMIDIKEFKKIQEKSEVKRKRKRNALTMLAREIIWQTRLWEKSGYWKWVEEFNPSIILLQAGDCGFMYRIALETTQRCNANLVIYNSEGYYFKNFDYFQGKGLAHLLYPVFLRQLKSALKKAYDKSSCVIYICDELRDEFDKVFNTNSLTIFTGSEIQFEEKRNENKVFTTVYCGNLGLKRHESLIEIGEVLQEISQDLFIDVYGKTPDKTIERKLKSAKGIHYHGLIPYEKVKEVLRDSDLILYVESFNSFYKEDIKFGFSTKIADSLASGNCFLLYAPEHFACYKYLKNNKIAFTAGSLIELKNILEYIISNPEVRKKYQVSALQFAEKNHRADKNNKKFQKLLNELKSKE